MADGLRIVIVGGVAAGMSAATRARRMNEGAQITVLERGGFVSFANCGLPYHVAGRIAQEEKLLITNPARLKERFNIDVRLHTEAVSIDRAARMVRVRDVSAGGGGGEELVPYDKLILAPGASAIVPAMEGLNSKNVFTVRSVEDTRAVQAYLALRKPERAVVVGAGFIGLEMVEALHDRGLSVTVVEKAGHVLPLMDAELAVDIEHELAAHRVEVIKGCGLAGVKTTDGSEAGKMPAVQEAGKMPAVQGAGKMRAVQEAGKMPAVQGAGKMPAVRRVTAVVLEDGREVAAEVVILSIGVRPNVELARAAGLRIGTSGGIAVDAVGRTSDADIYAAGDAAEVVQAVTGKAARVPLAGPANRAGRRAGEHAALSGQRGGAQPAGAGCGGASGLAATADEGVGTTGVGTSVAGTAIVQVFGVEAGMTGLSEGAARAAGFEADTAYVTAAHHAGYYPGASAMRIKLVYDRGTGRVLGGQAVGRAGVDKRLDVIATVLHFGGTIDDLAELDLAYAPQFGSAKDPVHMAAFVAQNQRSGLTPAIMPGQIDGRQLVDVRTAEEFARGHVAGAVNVPVDVLRQRAGELDRTRPTAVMCQIGLRGHVAARMLKQMGFGDVVNVKGGWELARRM